MKLSCRACIAKAGVWTQFGREIPDHDDLDPDGSYQIYLPTSVLVKLPEIADAVPIVDTHDFTDAPDFDPASVIGLARGIRYGQGRLWAYVSFWHPTAIAAIKSGNGPRQLSLGFRAKYEKRSGEFRGEAYDCVMVEMTTLDHVALLAEGEMGEDCALPPYQRAA